MGHIHETFVMFGISILAGVLSTMNIWVDNIKDVRFGLNDLYMVLLMTGWMFLFTGMYFKQLGTSVFGGILAIAMIIMIRKQMFVNGDQFRLGMIPHHSMAVHMSKKYLEKDDGNVGLRVLALKIIASQQQEIKLLEKL
ncbi:hypothetical protein PBCVAN69C_311L [Paramecium bursaria Chlorella virus AN69C]|uniref:DUF305 domain-containing protein n=2 Tax=Chlorovirus TaxID=181083 RepID=Q84590_PBCV1|nr:hypothetical protein PBCV1_A273L [Paramecium bursaria Chlorella virus 1]AAC96641.1 hypothetical protein [Paramecium bursaria Chlorella virus 1]AGE48442.1 hypothetical protein PBCVAN69C_311L [Paramecium bursaria Chlorella virus AN69C]AGE53851.1 hypothetical protein PBCVIL3A_303L [Paramecium bursaria Chlorella virus IL3A]AGE57283.1 hypothetical protein PBCVNEJV4_316L [Paramecium bursaria Chlorella virus NE-JV-4]